MPSAGFGFQISGFRRPGPFWITSFELRISLCIPRISSFGFRASLKRHVFVEVFLRRRLGATARRRRVPLRRRLVDPLGRRGSAATAAAGAAAVEELDVVEDDLDLAAL